MTPEQRQEWLLCAASKLYFAHTYCYIYDATARTWVPFQLWPEQARTLRVIQDNFLTIILKARQLGLTWLVLAFALHDMIFEPVATVLLFSRREEEAIYLLGRERLRGMYERLPDWMRVRGVRKNDATTWQLSNGSIARAFPTNAGDSYTATLAIVDEADLAPDLGKLMSSVKPTIDGGGRMILLSRSDKSEPQSEFKKIYRAAKAKINGWAHVFLPWFVRPDRDAAWYEAKRADIESRTTVLDELHEQYPATDTEALSPRSLDKRIPAIWLIPCYQEWLPLPMPADAPAINGLEIYAPPLPGRTYVIGGDPAEGNPTSDDSALTVVDEITGEEVAALSQKVEPTVLAAYADEIGIYYNYAGILPERNNHGHAMIAWLLDNSSCEVLCGLDERPGWLDSSKGKAILYSTAADNFREKDATIHSESTYTQLASIEGASLRAPKGEMDDRADSYSLAQVARTLTGEPFEAATGGSRSLNTQYGAR